MKTKLQFAVMLGISGLLALPGYVQAEKDTNNVGNTNYGEGALGGGWGISNSAFGYRALYGSQSEHNSGVGNTAVGAKAMLNTIDSPGSPEGGVYYNTAVGLSAMEFNTNGVRNTAVGAHALRSNTVGNGNTAVGESALWFSTTASNLTAVGQGALHSNTTGANNTAVGANSMVANTTGANNTAVGVLALSGLNEGGENIALGMGAGCSLGKGGRNIYIGNHGRESESDTLRIGVAVGSSTDVVGCGQDLVVAKPTAKTYIGGIYNSNLSNGVPVFVGDDGMLGIQVSGSHFIENIEPLGGPAGEKLMKLRPVSFHYKEAGKDGAKPLQYGLVAEEVIEVMPDLVHMDKDGKPYTVNYGALVPLMLAVMQRERQALMQQQALLTTLKMEIEVLKAGLQAIR